MSGSETQIPAIRIGVQSNSDVEFAKCECCGLTEECTPAYISSVRERNQGRWICGLCAEAVKDEMARSPERKIGNEEALIRHMNFCKNFRSSMTIPPPEDLISAVKQLLLRSLDTPRTPTRKEGAISSQSSSLVRSKSCYSTLDG